MKNVTKALTLLPLLAIALGCPGEKKQASNTIPVDSTKVDSTKLDTAKADLSNIKANVPEGDTTTPKQNKLPSGSRGGDVGSASSSRFPDAPAPLVDAVQREQAATRFCYTEFGQKADPTLRGAVAMLVTIGSSGVTDAAVESSNWTGATAGRAVNRCLNQKAKAAWNVAPGAVKPGKYVVQLNFSGAQ